MKKAFSFAFAIAALLFTSCTQTTYTVSYVDMKNPTDTLYTTVDMNERMTCKGQDTQFKVTCDNHGSINNPVFTYTLKGVARQSWVSGVLYASPYPITITGFNVTGLRR